MDALINLPVWFLERETSGIEFKNFFGSVEKFNNQLGTKRYKILFKFQGENHITSAEEVDKDALVERFVKNKYNLIFVYDSHMDFFLRISHE